MTKEIKQCVSVLEDLIKRIKASHISCIGYCIKCIDVKSLTFAISQLQRVSELETFIENNKKYVNSLHDKVSELEQENKVKKNYRGD